MQVSGLSLLSPFDLVPDNESDVLRYVDCAGYFLPEVRIWICRPQREDKIAVALYMSCKFWLVHAALPLALSMAVICSFQTSR